MWEVEGEASTFSAPPSLDSLSVGVWYLAFLAQGRLPVGSGTGAAETQAPMANRSAVTATGRRPIGEALGISGASEQQDAVPERNPVCPKFRLNFPVECLGIDVADRASVSTTPETL